MNSAVEQGLATYLAARLVAANFTVPVVLPGTSASTVPNSVPSVILVVGMTHDAGTLYSGALKAVISTPAKVEGFDLTSHKALVKQVKKELAWEPDDAAAGTKVTAINSAVHAASEFRCAGFFFKEPADAQADDMWQTTFEITLGLDGPHASAS